MSRSNEVTPEERVIKNYRISKNVIGTGISHVHLATQLDTNKTVAAKLIKWHKNTDPKDIVGVRREIEALKLISHPNVVQLFDVYDQPDETILFLQHWGGGNLLQYVASQKKLPEPQARLFFIQMVDALECMHGHHIVHRDLKPENVLLDEAHERVILCDFGLCNPDHRKKMKTLCGTHDYVPPEILMGEDYDGVAVDLWSLGIVLYYMLCGRVPFNHGQMTMRLSMVIAGEFDFESRDQLSSEARSLVKALIVTDPHGRIPLSQVKKHAWLELNRPADAAPTGVKSAPASLANLFQVVKIGSK